MKAVRSYILGTLCLGLCVACVGETPPNEMRPPDPDLITVYYPVDLVVYGRGGPGSIPEDADCLYLSAHPSSKSRGVPVNDDGSFTFSISASSSDILELAAFKSETDGPDRCKPADERGGSLYVQIPATPVYGDDFTCCLNDAGTQGGCKAINFDDGQKCTPPTDDLLLIPANRCLVDEDCAHFSLQTISMPDGAFQISPPNETGVITIRALPNVLPPELLFRVENRGNAQNRPLRNSRTVVLSDEQGAFALEMVGRGDDEIVLRAFDFDSARSREHSLFVPDAPLEGLDILGVFPRFALAPNSLGVLGIRFAPYGRDRRGMCIDMDDLDSATSQPHHPLCFSADSPDDGYSGGIEYASLSFENLLVDGQASEFLPTQIDPANDLDYVKWRDGDVLGDPQTVMVIVDHSAEAVAKDPRLARRDAAENFVRAKRSVDKMGLWAVCDSPQQELDANGKGVGYVEVLRPTADKAALLAGIRAMEESICFETPMPNAVPIPYEGEARLLTAMTKAAERLILERTQHGRIFVIAGDGPVEESAALDKFLDTAAAREQEAFEGFPTFVVGFGIRSHVNYDLLNSAAIFSDGEITALPTTTGLLNAVAGISGKIAGAFVLLYDLVLPGTAGSDAGKVASISFDAILRVRDWEGQERTARGSFSGLIFVKDGSG